MDAFPLIHAFGLNALLTEQDDPQLWETALREHWHAPDDPTIIVDALRFNIGRMLASGETAQGEENTNDFNRRGMVDVQEWWFEPSAPGQLRLKDSPPPPPQAAILSSFSVMDMFSSKPGMNPIPAPAIYMYLGITRPSRGVDEAVVYRATSMPGVGDGLALVWRRMENGQWQPTDQCTARWFT